ncbi:MAG: SLC13 family permease [Caulobacteraceae bacterium]
MLQNHLLIAIIIFALTYCAIIYEKINRMIVALLGALLMIAFQVVSQEHAVANIDFNTIGLLIGMMIIVLILKRTGFFQYVAIKAAKQAKGEPWKILVLFAAATAIASALLDNVTTILLIAPVTLVITDTLKIDPTPFLFTEIFAANIGGTATLIGDPPNIMIGGATQYSFVDFLFNLTPITLVIFAVTVFLLVLVYRKRMLVKEEDKRKVLRFDESKAIQDKNLLVKSLIVLIITIIGFTLHSALHLESATIALFGAVVLLLISGLEPEDVLMEIEWTTIFFFIGLFVLVGALVEVGLIDSLAKKVMGLTNGNLMITTMLILWMSALLSAFLDNIPFVATMIPLIKSIEVLSGIQAAPLWWALSLGACLGGNGTIIGASANVIAGGMLEKHGHKLKFFDYMKVGFPLMLISIILSAIYLIVFYM